MPADLHGMFPRCLEGFEAAALVGGLPQGRAAARMLTGPGQNGQRPLRAISGA